MDSDKGSDYDQSGAQSAERTDCPHCGRKLLSIRSILCNWCGRRIDDPAYLERAAHERAIQDAKLRDQVDKEQDETIRMGILGRLARKGKAPSRPPILIPPPDK